MYPPLACSSRPPGKHVETDASENPKRGYSHAEAIRYTGVGRRVFDGLWRPHLNPIRIGTRLVFDKAELDHVFELFKSGALPDGTEAAHNDPLNGWPMPRKGETFPWAEKRRASARKKTEPGQSTKYGVVKDFASAASQAIKRQKAGS